MCSNLNFPVNHQWKVDVVLFLTSSETKEARGRLFFGRFLSPASETIMLTLLSHNFHDSVLLAKLMLGVYIRLAIACYVW